MNGRNGGGKDIFSTHDAAKVCRVTPMTVIRWIEEGKIPAFKTVGGHRRIRREDLEAFCRARGIPFDAGDAGRILIVDADPVTRDGIAEAARAVDGRLTIEIATDPFGAGMAMARFRPHLVFLDQRVPGLDALEICQRLARDPDAPGVALVVIAQAASPDLERALRSRGAIACLARPVDPARIDAIVRAALQLPSEGDEVAPTILVVDEDGAAERALRGQLEAFVPGARLAFFGSAIDAMLAIGSERPSMVVIGAAAGAADVARRLRGRRETSAISVVAVGDSSGMGKAESLSAGAVAWLDKPVTAQALAALVAPGRAAAGSPTPVDESPRRKRKR